MCGETGQRSRYSDWTVRGSNSGESEIFRTRPDRPFPSSLLYSVYRVSLPGEKRPGPGVDHRPSCGAKIKEVVKLYFYFPSDTSWPILP